MAARVELEKVEVEDSAGDDTRLLVLEAPAGCVLALACDVVSCTLPDGVLLMVKLAFADVEMRPGAVLTEVVANKLDDVVLPVRGPAVDAFAVDKLEERLDSGLTADE